MNENAYGTLEKEMRAMKDGRRDLVAGLRENRADLRRATGQVLAGAQKLVGRIGAANRVLANQTRAALAGGRKERRVETRQTMAEIDHLLGAIRRDVTALKADAGRITGEARDFLAQTGSDNAKLRTQTHKSLASARVRTKTEARQALAEAGKVMAETKEAVAGLKAQTGQMLREAGTVMKGLCTVSRQRTAAWQEIIRTMQGGGSRGVAGQVTVQKPRKHAGRGGKRKAS